MCVVYIHPIHSQLSYLSTLVNSLLCPSNVPKSFGQITKIDLDTVRMRELQSTSNIMTKTNTPAGQQPLGYLDFSYFPRSRQILEMTTYLPIHRKNMRFCHLVFKLMNHMKTTLKFTNHIFS